MTVLGLSGVLVTGSNAQSGRTASQGRSTGSSHKNNAAKIPSQSSSSPKLTPKLNQNQAQRINAQRINAQRLLESSIEMQDFVGVQRALNQGANPQLANREGQTPLEQALYMHEWQSANLIRLRGAKIEKVRPRLLMTAAEEGDGELVARLLKLGIQRKGLFDELGQSLLVVAVSGGDDESDSDSDEPRSDGQVFLEESFEVSQRLPVVKALLAAGENPRLPDKTGQLPLQAAAALGRVELMKLLLDKGAPINATNKRGLTPLFEATPFSTKSERHRAARALLLSRGADVNVGTPAFGQSPFHYAVREGRDDLVREFLSRGAKVNAPKNDGQTPLIIAMREARVSTAQILLEKGADPSLKDLEGRTALDFEKLGLGDDEAQRVLIIDSDSKGSQRETPEFFDEAMMGKLTPKFWADIAKRRAQIAALIRGREKPTNPTLNPVPKP